MMPRSIIQKQALPKTANGKMNRRELLAEAVALLLKKEPI